MLVYSITSCAYALMSKRIVPKHPAMGYTAIMTEKDRERISGESTDPDSKRYESASRVRKRIEALEQDTEILKEYHPKLYDELREVVCE